MKKATAMTMIIEAFFIFLHNHPFKIDKWFTYVLYPLKNEYVPKIFEAISMSLILKFLTIFLFFK
mgnify:CR=1 FL=1